jgi:hypothetical protein
MLGGNVMYVYNSKSRNADVTNVSADSEPTTILGESQLQSWRDLLHMPGRNRSYWHNACHSKLRIEKLV